MVFYITQSIIKLVYILSNLSMNTLRTYCVFKVVLYVQDSVTQLKWVKWV